MRANRYNAQTPPTFQRAVSSPQGYPNPGQHADEAANALRQNRQVRKKRRFYEGRPDRDGLTSRFRGIKMFLDRLYIASGKAFLIQALQLSSMPAQFLEYVFIVLASVEIIASLE